MGVVAWSFILFIVHRGSAEPVVTSQPEKSIHPTAGFVLSPDSATRDFVESVRKNPGFFSQMCSIPVEASQQMFSPYCFSRYEHRVSTDKFQKLRTTRGQSLAVLRERLEAAIKTRQAASAPSESISGFSSNELVMVIDLNGVELLDGLCDLTAPTKVRHDPALVSTNISDVGTGAGVVRQDDDASRVNEVFSTITAILRQEWYKPLLESDLEREFRIAVKKKRANGDKTLSKDEPNSWCYYDSICNEFVSFAPYCWMGLTPERQKQIIGWARDLQNRRRRSDGLPQGCHRGLSFVNETRIAATHRFAPVCDYRIIGTF
jgi:hypothetical protein